MEFDDHHHDHDHDQYDDYYSIVGSIRILALTLTGLAVLLTLYCSRWLVRHRQARIITSHQPEFLFVICFGIFLWEISIVPYSINDSRICTNTRIRAGCTMACLSYQWLYNIGFTITFAGLYSKLWRINKIFHQPQFRRISVTVGDVLKPFAVLFSYTFLVLLLWTILDPPVWTPIEILVPYYNSTTSNSTAPFTHGSCQPTTVGMGIGNILASLLFLGHIVVVLATIRQAYLARNVSSDFSETWPLALGLLNWIQLSIIGIPVEALITYVAPSASYFLRVVIVLAQSLTILLAVICPLYLHPSLQRSPPVILGDTVHVTRRMEHRHAQPSPYQHHTAPGNTDNDDSTIHHQNDVDGEIMERQTNAVGTSEKSGTHVDESIDYKNCNENNSTGNNYNNYNIDSGSDDTSQQQRHNRMKTTPSRIPVETIPTNDATAAVAVVTPTPSIESSGVRRSWNNERNSHDHSHNNVVDLPIGYEKEKDDDDDETIEC